MPKLWITEYGHLQDDGRRSTVPVPAEPSFTQAVPFGKASLSAPFRPSTVFVRLISNADAHVEFGLDPKATSDSQPIFAKCEAFRRVKPGHRISVYDGVS
jgi:hypothetical protein